MRYYILFFALILFACTTNTSKNGNVPFETRDTIQQETNPDKKDSVVSDSGTFETNSDNSIVDDAFISKILRTDLSYSAISKIKSLTTTSFVVENKVTEETYLSGKNDSFRFFRNNNNIFLERARIMTSIITLNKTIVVGMDKNSFGKVLSIAIVPDSFNISDLEAHCNFQFIFKADTLHAIVYELNYLD